MVIGPIQNVFFDDEATLAMGAAFDLASSSLRYFARVEGVRDLVAAKNGKRVPIRLCSQVLMGFSIDDVSMPVVSVSPDPRGGRSSSCKRGSMKPGAAITRG
jgi:hypothetical protein